MHDLTNLKDMLVKELEEFGKNGTLSKTSLDSIDKLAHATKNVIKIIDCCESKGCIHETRRDVEVSRKESSENPKGEIYRLIENTSDKYIKDELRSLLDRI